MKKTILFLCSALFFCEGFAQRLRVYHGNTLVATYYENNGSRFVFDDDSIYVDLGLPSKTMWATFNIGATKPEEYGTYFAWAETTPQPNATYTWSSYKWCNGTSTTLTKYCNSSSYGTIDNLTQLESTDDAATATWGDSWCTPTADQIKELRDNCTWTASTLNNVAGITVTGTNGNSIFLPAAGYYNNGKLTSATTEGYYWSSTLYTAGGSDANCTSAYVLGGKISVGYYIRTTNQRFFGCPIRPVKK